jgi:signal transduction histidine kinase
VLAESVLMDRSNPAGDLDVERAALREERRAVERLRRDLLGTVSHEVRTPLTLIRTSIGLLLDSQAGKSMDAAMRDRLLHNIKHSADRMHRLVTDMLDLARLQSGHAELQVRWLDVEQLAHNAATLAAPLFTEKRQQLVVETAGTRGASHVSSRGAGEGGEARTDAATARVMGDPHRLEQVLLNLLSNASKFSPSGARVTIRVEPGDEEVTICVADTGPGIAPEAQRHLFEQFFTDRTSSPPHQVGAGLGLPIAKGLVEAHGGRIWVESSVGAGTTFCFSLPVGGPPGAIDNGAEDDNPVLQPLDLDSDPEEEIPGEETGKAHEMDRRAGGTRGTR